MKDFIQQKLTHLTAEIESRNSYKENPAMSMKERGQMFNDFVKKFSEYKIIDFISNYNYNKIELNIFKPAELQLIAEIAKEAVDMNSYVKYSQAYYERGGK